MLPIFSLAGAIATPLGIGFFASSLSMKDVLSLWPKLNKPPWCPPAAVFGPAWSVMYALMGGASWLAVRAAGPAVLLPYAMQLALNAAWNPLFFVAKRPDVALLDIVGLGVAAGVTTGGFWAADWRAGALMVPYLGWIAFATALTWEFLKRNPEFWKDGAQGGESERLMQG
jgi:translocator protein